MNDRLLEKLRMLADWQLVRMRYNPLEITLACMAKDAMRGRPAHPPTQR